MTTFVDTSALYALLDEADDNHRAAVASLSLLRGRDLHTHAYVVVEALALIGRRLGWAAVERLIDVFLPLIHVQAVDETLHQAALIPFRASGADRVSLVDRTSFAFMRQLGLVEAFAFDAHFAREGFTLVLPPNRGY